MKQNSEPAIHILRDTLFSVSLALKLSGFVSHPPNWNESKRKRDYTLWNVVEGTVCIEIHQKTYIAYPGDVVIFSPNVHYKAYTGSNGCKFLFHRFSLDIGYKNDALAEMNLSGLVREKYLGNACLAFCKNTLQKPLNHNPLEKYASFLSYLSQLLYVADAHMEHFFPLGKPNHNDSITFALRYLNKHFTEPVNIKEIALQCHLSEKYFIHHFTEMVGISPKKYIIECRMRYAEELLRATNQKISDIATHIGYTDAYSFSKAFHKRYNQSPSEFRKNA